MTDFIDEKDEFWDISKLVPKARAPLKQFSSSVKVKEYVSDEPKLSSVESGDYATAPESRKLDFSVYAKENNKNAAINTRSYFPKENRLISKVTIKPSLDRFDFYDTFRKAALIYFDYKCPKCDFVQFYSYKPQYSQMTAEQKKYYFYWRDEVRHKRYIKTDYSYIYLYAYEILNLPEKIGKDEGLRLLCEIWQAYRRELVQIDSYFALWVQDYCLVYELECPYDYIKDFLFDVITVSSFKEFYIADLNSAGSGSLAMIAYLSDYDWRRGKYAGGENSEFYRARLEGAMQRVFARLLYDDLIYTADISKITRTAFAGSLCTHSVKCILEVEYTSIAESVELRAAVTAALKYTENKLRACLGVKSRLAVKELPDSLRRVIDKYFESEFERLKREKQKANEPEYERLYDASNDKISFADAIEIEKASWKMTARLVEGTEDYEAENSNLISENNTEDKTETNLNDNELIAEDSGYGLNGMEIAFLSAAYHSNYNEMQTISKNNGVPTETIAEKINEAFSDHFGDVILEQSEIGGFKVIDDYCEEIGEWLQKIQK